MELDYDVFSRRSGPLWQRERLRKILNLEAISHELLILMTLRPTTLPRFMVAFGHLSKQNFAKSVSARD